MKKNLCRAALLAFAFSLTVVPAGRSNNNPHICHEGAPCTANADCGGCFRCGDFCIEGACICG